jgi:hypothetical protein
MVLRVGETHRVGYRFLLQYTYTLTQGNFTVCGQINGSYEINFNAATSGIDFKTNTGTGDVFSIWLYSSEG